jgi:GntR family transcriptional regulator, transcriptional repressor for pyruvate dehydrogenase complex
MRPFAPAGKTKRQPDAITDIFKDYIRTEGLFPGSRLLRERELIDRFKASKGTVREALKALETQGLIFTRSGPGGGAFVAQPSAQHAMEFLSSHFFFNTPSLSDIYAIRKAREPEVAAQLAGLVTGGQLERVRFNPGHIQRP